MRSPVLCFGNDWKCKFFLEIQSWRVSAWDSCRNTKVVSTLTIMQVSQALIVNRRHHMARVQLFSTGGVSKITTLDLHSFPNWSVWIHELLTLLVVLLIIIVRDVVESSECLLITWNSNVSSSYWHNWRRVRYQEIVIWTPYYVWKSLGCLGTGSILLNDWLLFKLKNTLRNSFVFKRWCVLLVII